MPVLRCHLLLLIGLIAGLLLLSIAPTNAPASAQTDYVRSERLGLAFVSAVGVANSDPRYGNALILGAGWNRYPLYWYDVETAPGVFTWTSADRVIVDDVRYGLRTNAILLGKPSFHSDGTIPRGLYAPIFSDGTDNPGANRLPNLGNPWAVYVWNVVQRYRPGGALAGLMGWNAGQGVRAWEVWNEPDLALFWRGSAADYARMLKVAYLVIKSLDPGALVIAGGLADGDPPTAGNEFLAQMLGWIGQDAARVASNWYMDVVAVHSYTNPLRTRRSVERTREILARFGIDRPIWLTEFGLPVWDDYPGPITAAGTPDSRSLLGTERQQAAYLLQSAALAWGAGADVLFWHQLYDDCGNQASGTDFAPGQSSGDAHGLFRNDRGAPCFRQHPQPGTPRLSAGAYMLAASILGRGTLLDARIFTPSAALSDAFAVTFDLEENFQRQRVTVVWSRRGTPTIEIPSSAPGAAVYSANAATFTLIPSDGWYRLDLPDPALLDMPSGSTGQVGFVGGSPYLVVELLLPGTTPSPFQPRTPGQPALLADGSLPAATPTPEPTATLLPTATIGPTPTPLPIPTFDPALTLAPPVVFMSALPEVSPPEFTVRWGAYDPISIAGYLVWVRVDGGEWLPWVNTTAIEMTYIGQSGQVIEFAVWGVNRAGGWSAGVELVPMARTRVG
jgi:hypothetical protein